MKTLSKWKLDQIQKVTRDLNPAIRLAVIMLLKDAASRRGHRGRRG